MHGRSSSVEPKRTVTGLRGARRNGFLPRVEGLEDRCLLSFTEFPLPVPNSFPAGIVGDENYLWYTLQGPGDEPRIGIMATTGEQAEIPVQTEYSRPNGITVGPDGNLWFTEQLSNQIGRIDQDGNITEFYLEELAQYPTGITAGLDGNLWFTCFFGNAIGVMTTEGEVLANIILNEPNSQPAGIATDFFGNIWFTEFGRNAIGRITPDGFLDEFPIPTRNSQPVGIAAGWDGRIWFTESNGNKIGVIDAEGNITEYAIPTANSWSQAIVQGFDGNLWFTETGRAGSGNKLGRITPEGVITEYVIPTADSQPLGITVGPDGNIWFVETSGNKIGRWEYARSAPGGGDEGHDPSAVPMLLAPTAPVLNPLPFVPRPFAPQPPLGAPSDAAAPLSAQADEFRKVVTHEGRTGESLSMASLQWGIGEFGLWQTRHGACEAAF